MSRSLVLLIGVVILGGCGQRPAPVAPPQPGLEPRPTPGERTEPQPPVSAPTTPPGTSGDSARQERLDAALLEAYTQLARGKYAEALTALEVAKTIDPTEQVQRETDRVRAILAQQEGAARAIADIRTVLQEGKAEEAARLAGQALVLYGTTESTAELAQLKRQADALLAAQSNEAAGTRAARLRLEVQTALKPEENNLRAAVVALEQLDAVDESPEVDQQLTALRTRLTAYDTARRRAQELSNEPATLEEALEQLQAAAEAWDTFQVRREIEETNRALSLRKPRLAVADFDVRGEIAPDDAGKTIAEELLPAFKNRFDLVERGQLVKVLEELKLETGDALVTEAARRELARLARVRYLVVGSVSHLGRLAVNARVIDLQTGLIVQTGRILAENEADLRRQLPQLGAILQMSDEEKLAFEAQLQQQAQAAQPVPAVQPLPPQMIPPAPEPLPQGQPLPPAVVTVTIVPPGIGKVAVEDLDRLPGVPPVPAPVVVVPEQEEPLRQQMLHLVLEVGDNHFRRGQFAQAFRCFDMAVALAGPRPELVLRLDRCRPMLPPGFVLLPPRPRVAVLNFCTHGRVPPGLNHWVADALTWYLPPDFEVVPRGELFWYMGRLGMTVGDVIHNPSARRWLARLLGVRYFIVGSIRETASYDVTSHLLDAEFGWEVARSWIHVHDVAQLKMCLPELVRRLFLTPAERARLQAEAEAARLQAAQFERLAAEERLRRAREADNFQLLLFEARRQSTLQQFAIAVELLLNAQRMRPENVEVQALLQQQRERQRQAEFNRRWQQNTVVQRVAFEEMQRKQADLNRAVEDARLRAEREAAQRAEAERRDREAERDRVRQETLTRAQKALQGERFDLAISLFRDVLDLKPGDAAATQGLANARAGRDRARQIAEAQEKQRKEEALRKQREQELAKLQAQLEAERRTRELQEQAVREAQAARDRESFAKLLQDARDALKRQQVDAAMNSLQTARRLRPQQSNEVDPIWNEALALQNRLNLEKLEAGKRAEFEKQQAIEKAAREKAEREAALARTLYTTLVTDARKATFDGKHAVAIGKYEEALKLFRTDEAAQGLQKAKEALAREQTLKNEAARLAAELKKLRDDGLKALNDREYAKAKQLLTDFNKRQPGDVQVLAALGQAEQSLAQAQTQARRDEERKQRDAEFAKLFAGGKANYEAKQYAAAIAALKEATRLRPENREAANLLTLAEKAQTSVTEAEKAKQTQFQKLISDGRQALTARQYDPAEKAFLDARKLYPMDKSIDGFLADIKKGRDEEAARLRAEAMRREEEQRKAQQLTATLTAFRQSLAKKDLTEAARLVDAAAKQAPANPDVKKAQADLAAAEAQARAEAEALKKRQDQVNTLIIQARTALQGNKPEEALKLLAQANDLVPNNPTVTILRNQANAAIAAGLKTRIDTLVADARKAMAAKDLPRATQLLRDARQLGPQDAGVTLALADLDKLAKEPAPNPRKADYDLAMSAAKAAFEKKNYTGAVNSYKEALRLMPGDREATLKLAETERLQADANRANALTAAINAAQAALAGKKYDDALKAVNQALTLQPNHPEARKLALDIQKAKADADEQGKRAQFTQLLNQARAAITARKFAEAVQHLENAGKLYPADRELPALMKQARDGLTPMPMPMPNPMANFQKQMDAGAAAERTRNFTAAIAAYTEALKLKPNDVVAKVALQRVQSAQGIAKHLADGQAALRAQKWADAEKAFNEVLKIDPRNADAKEGLQRARQKR